MRDSFDTINSTSIIGKDDIDGRSPMNGPFIGIVKDAHDPMRCGRIRVWLESHGDDESNSLNWLTVSYMSPFYGISKFKYEDDTPNHYDKNGQSYGMWFTAPDVGNRVMCFFVNGDPNLGYFIGYIPEMMMNHMIPAHGARTTDKVDFEGNPNMKKHMANAKEIPVGDFEKSIENMGNEDFHNAKRPIHPFKASQMWRQGTESDKIRGPIGSSVQRESPSFAFGINTPGRHIVQESGSEDGSEDELPHTEGRQSGHSLTMDDGDIEKNDILMRMRSSSGHQITMSDTGNCIYIQHATGMSWIELGTEGTLDIYAANSVNIRTKGEVNIHSDGDMNFHSNKNINMYAKEKINLESDTDILLTGHKSIHAYSDEKILVKSDGNIGLHSKTNSTIRADGDILETGNEIRMNSSPKAPTINKPVPKPKNKLPEVILKGKDFWTVEKEQLKTITTRAPTHEPYPLHTEGVPLSINIDDKFKD